MRKLGILIVLFAFVGCASIPVKKPEPTVSLKEYKKLKKFVFLFSQEFVGRESERLRFQERVMAEFKARDKKLKYFVGWFGIIMADVSKNFKQLYENQAILSNLISSHHPLKNKKGVHSLRKAAKNKKK